MASSEPTNTPSAFEVDEALAAAQKITTTSSSTADTALRWVASVLPWVILVAALDNIAGVEFWTDLLGLDYKNTSCAARGWEQPETCVTVALPTLLFGTLCNVCALLCVRSIRMRLRTVPVMAGALVVVIACMFVTDEAYERPVEVVRPVLSCGGRRVEAYCRGDHFLEPDGSIRREKVGCGEESCQAFMLETGTKLYPFLWNVATQAGELPMMHCVDNLYNFAFGVDTVTDFCDSGCNRVPTYCRDVCLQTLVGCGRSIMERLDVFLNDTGLLQRYRGERVVNGTGHPVYSMCLRDIIHDLANGCENVPPCGATTDKCAPEDLLGLVAEPYELPFAVSSQDVRDKAKINGGARKAVFIVAALVTVVVGVAMQMRQYEKTLGKMERNGEPPRLWAIDRLQTGEYKLGLYDKLILALACSIGTLLFSIAAAAALRIETNGAENWWQTLCTFLLMFLCSALALIVTALIHGWHSTVARLCRDYCNNLLSPTWGARINDFLEQLDSPSAGIYYVFYTMGGDCLEVISQSSAITAKAPVTDYDELFAHTLLLLTSLVLGTVCVVLAVAMRNTNFCLLKMVVDTAADIAYLTISFVSPLFAEDFGLTIGFVVPAVLLGVRTINLTISVFDILKCRLMLDFRARHATHPLFNAEAWPVGVDHLKATVARTASVKARGVTLPYVVMVFYFGLIATCTVLLDPPREYKAVCAAMVGGDMYYEPMHPQVTTAGGLFADPECDFTLLEEYKLTGKGLTDIPFELLRVLEVAKVKHVDLSGNALTQIPHGFENFTFLESLDLSNNNISWLNLSRVPSDELRNPDNIDDYLDINFAGNPIAEVVDVSYQVFPRGRIVKGFGRWFRTANVLNLNHVDTAEMGIDEFPAMAEVTEVLMDQYEGTPFFPLPPKTYKVDWGHCRDKVVYINTHKKTIPCEIVQDQHPGMALDSLTSSWGLDMDYVREQPDHYLQLAIRWTEVLVTGPSLVLFQGANVTFGSDRIYKHRAYPYFDLRHSRCVEFQESCRVDGLGKLLMQQLPDVPPPEGERIFRLLGLNIDEGTIDHDWSPGIARDIGRMVDHMFFWGEFRSRGNALGKLPAASGDQWETFKAALKRGFAQGENLGEVVIVSEHTDNTEFNTLWDEILGLHIHKSLAESAPGYSYRDVRWTLVDSPVIEGIFRREVASKSFEEMESWSTRWRRYLEFGNDLIQDLCVSQSTCPTVMLPQIFSHARILSYDVVLGGSSSLEYFGVSRSHLTVDESFSPDALMGISMYDVTVENDDWFSLGFLIGGAPQFGYSMTLTFLGFSWQLPAFTLAFQYFEDGLNAFVHPKHRQQDYVPRDFCDGFFHGNHTPTTDGYWLYVVVGSPLRFEGYTISITQPWVARSYSLSFGHAPVVEPTAFDGLFQGLVTPYTVLETLEFFSLTGSFGASFAVLPSLEKTDFNIWDPWNELKEIPLNVRVLRIHNIAEDTADIVGYVTESLKEGRIFSYVEHLELNEMGIDDASARAVLDAIETRTSFLAPVDLGLRTSTVTDDLLDDMSTRIAEQRFCPGSLDIDLSYEAKQNGVAPSYSAAGAARLLAAAVSQFYFDSDRVVMYPYQEYGDLIEPNKTWCWMMALTIPHDMVADVRAAAKAAVPAEKHFLVDDVLDHRWGSTMTDFFWWNLNQYEFGWDEGADYEVGHQPEVYWGGTYPGAYPHARRPRGAPDPRE